MRRQPERARVRAPLFPSIMEDAPVSVFALASTFSNIPGVCLSQALARTQALAEDVINRNHEPTQDRADQHAEDDDDPERVAAAGPCPGGPRHRQNPNDEGEGRHQDRPQPLPRRFLGGLEDPRPLLPQVLGKLDDQDRVLGLQADQHHQADLAEDVERHVVDPEADHRAEGRQGDRDDDHQRQHPALVEGRHEQKNADDREGEDVTRLAPGLLLLVGRPGPLVAEALGQDLGGDLLHRPDRLARAIPRRRLAGDLRGIIHVVVRNIGWPDDVLHVPECAERHLPGARTVQNVQLHDVVRPRPRGSLGLDHHLPGFVIKIKIVDVGGTQVGLEDVENRGDVHLVKPGLDAVEVEPELGDAGREGGIDPQQLGPFDGVVGRRQELVGHGRQRLDPLARAVLDLEFEAAGLAQPADRRGLEHDRPGTPDLFRDRLLELPRQCPRAEVRSGALRPFLEDHEDGCRIRLVGAVDQVQTVQDQHVAHPFELLGDAADALDDPARGTAGRTVGGLDRDDQVTLVLIRDEPLGPLDQHVSQEDHQTDGEGDDDPPVARGPVEERVVRVLDPLQRPVEPAEEEELRLPCPVCPRPEEQPRHRGAQRQRVERREEEREHDRQRELVVEPAGEPRNERHGHEHRGQHESDRDDRRGHLGHRVPRRLPQRLAQLELTLHVLDDDDRVVHDQPDRQHQPAQRQRIDREAEGRHQRKRGHQRDRDRDHRDDRRPEPLEEDEHDDHDQHERLDQRVLDLLDVLVDVPRRVVDDPILQARRKAPGKLIHLGPDLADDVERIRVGKLVDRDRARRLAVERARRSRNSPRPARSARHRRVGRSSRRVGCGR